MRTGIAAEQGRANAVAHAEILSVMRSTST
jgi:hypothetical protein